MKIRSCKKKIYIYIVFFFLSVQNLVQNAELKFWFYNEHSSHYSIHLVYTHTQHIHQPAHVHLHLYFSMPHQIICWFRPCNSASLTSYEGTLSLWQSYLLFDAVCEWLNKARSCSIFMTQVTGEGTRHTRTQPSGLDSLLMLLGLAVRDFMPAAQCWLWPIKLHFMATHFFQFLKFPSTEEDYFQSNLNVTISLLVSSCLCGCQTHTNPNSFS